MMIIVLFVVLSFLLWRAYADRQGREAPRRQQRRPAEVVEGVVRSNRQVGRNTAGAMKGLKFPGG
jgi:hypothetical protein